VNNLLIALLLLTTGLYVSAQEDYARIIPSPLKVTDPWDGGFWGPTVVDDTTMAYGIYKMDTKSLVWSPLPLGGINDIEKSSDPIRLPDGLLYYFRQSAQVVAYDPNTGRKIVVDSFYNYGGLGGITISRHPSGVYLAWSGNDPLHVWWPSQQLHHIRPYPHRMQVLSTLPIVNDGRIFYGPDEANSPIMRSTNLGLTWDTLFAFNRWTYLGLRRLYVFKKYINFYENNTGDDVYFIDIDSGDSTKYKERMAGGNAIATTDTLYSFNRCTITHITLDTASYRYALDTLEECFTPYAGVVPYKPPFLAQAEPNLVLQLPDGRTYMNSNDYGNSNLISSITSVTQRPFRIDNIYYSCDTMQFLIRSDNPERVQFSYSNNAGISIARREKRYRSEWITCVRERGFTGHFTIIATDGTLVDTVYCADLRNEREFHLTLQQRIAPSNELVLEPSAKTMEELSLIKWYRNGSPITWEETRGRGALGLVDPIPGRYHAVVMTNHWCATVTDTVEVVSTGVNEPLTQTMDVEAATVDVVDITGRFLARSIKATNTEEILTFVQQLNQGFKVVRNARGEILELHAVYLGNCLLVRR